MFNTFILLTVVCSAFGAIVPEGMLPQIDGRIVGGEATSISNFPWQVSLQRSGSHACGGSIYSAKIIVTAAHCLQTVTASMMRVRAGSSFWNSGGVLINVAAFQNHEDYNPSTMANDIAIVRLVSSLTFSSTIQAIDLVSKAPANGATATVSGWGTTSFGSASIPSQLNFIEVKIVDTIQCASSAYGYGSEIKPSMICAYTIEKGACQGDFGGPMVSGGLLAGVASWGYGCAKSDFPSVYANIVELRSWIIDTAANL